MAKSPIKISLWNFKEFNVGAGTDLNGIKETSLVRYDNSSETFTHFPNVNKWGTIITIIPNVKNIANLYGCQIVIPNDPAKIAVRGYTKNNGFGSWKYITPTSS